MLAKSLVRACSAMGARGRFVSQHVANKYNSGDQERACGASPGVCWSTSFLGATSCVLTAQVSFSWFVNAGGRCVFFVC